LLRVISFVVSSDQVRGEVGSEIVSNRAVRRSSVKGIIKVVESRVSFWSLLETKDRFDRYVKSSDIIW